MKNLRVLKEEKKIIIQTIHCVVVKKNFEEREDFVPSVLQNERASGENMHLIIKWIHILAGCWEIAWEGGARKGGRGR